MNHNFLADFASESVNYPTTSSFVVLECGSIDNFEGTNALERHRIQQEFANFGLHACVK